ncbi:MAG: glycosyltransferase family 2 protein [archaeon]
MISIIIPTYNAADTLYACLESISNLDHNNYEVIIVDDCSTDNSVEIARKFNVTVIAIKTNFGPAICRNKGAEIAKGDILAFVDSDCEVPRDWLKNFERIFETKDVAAISGSYSRFVKRNFVSQFQHYNTCYIRRDIPEYTENCTSSNLACKKDFFFKVGGFPNMRAAEDLQFGSKLSRIAKIYWMGCNGVAHNYKEDVKSYFKQQKSWAIAIIQSYLSKPSIFLEGGGFSKRNIAFELILLMLMLVASVFAVFDSFFLVGVLFFSLLILLINVDFLVFAKKRVSSKFAFLSALLILFRDGTWLYGLVLGVLKFPFKDL